MKVLYLSNGLTHYYNLVLSRLNKVPGVELVVIAPKQVSPSIGDGVYQTKDGVSFKIVELEEFSRLRIYSSFKGLVNTLLKEKPNVIIVSEIHLLTFLFNVPCILLARLFSIKLILKSIPFRMLRYEDAKKEIRENPAGIEMFPRNVNRLLLKSGLIKLIRRLFLYMRKISLNIPNAHVNYVEDAFEILGSYGVPKEKIFITYNSPDTDMLFEIKKSLMTVDPVLPPCEHRLIHVGRLVEWKRVDLLIRALARVKAQFQDAELLIIGSGPQEEALKALSSELHLEADIRFLGAIHDPMILGRYLMSSTVYVLAGMGGLSINDAMCFGLPVICSVGDGTEKKLVRDEFNGKYFLEGNKDDLVEKILYLFNNPELRKHMGINSTEIIRNEVNIHTVINGYVKALASVDVIKL